jgi:hypothetical protein
MFVFIGASWFEIAEAAASWLADTSCVTDCP